MAWSLLNNKGKRKYLTKSERARFHESSRLLRHDIHLFCAVLAAAGCRISEALALTVESFDFDNRVVVVESLKKRRRGLYREIPLPSSLLGQMKDWIESLDISPGTRLWSWSRMTAYRHICVAMGKAGLEGEHASPKGLRHGFAVSAIQAGVPLNLVQRWLGHADMATTAIYAAAMGPEERDIAARMWRSDEDSRSHPKNEETPVATESTPRASDADDRKIARKAHKGCDECEREHCQKALNHIAMIAVNGHFPSNFEGFFDPNARRWNETACPMIHFWLIR